MPNLDDIVRTSAMFLVVGLGTFGGYHLAREINTGPEINELFGACLGAIGGKYLYYFADGYVVTPVIERCSRRKK